MLLARIDVAERCEDSRNTIYWEAIVVKKGQEQVSRADSPRQGEHVDPSEGKIKHQGGSQNQTNARPQGEGSSSKG